MKTLGIIFFAALFLLLTACVSTTATELIPTEFLATNTPPYTEIPLPSATATLSKTVIYDFLESACEAQWSNNGQEITCPSTDYVGIGSGYVGVLDNPNVEGLGKTSQPALLTHPSTNGSFIGIFGAYPPMTIQAGDEFHATLACLEEVEAASCNVTFSLEFYDEQGIYVGSEHTGWAWKQSNDSSTAEIFVDLDRLAGQTVRLTLVVRDNGDPDRDYALWLNPQLLRTQ